MVPDAQPGVSHPVPSRTSEEASMPVAPAERDAKRERAFALAAQRVPYREIARQLGINKSTVVEYVRIERRRRSRDRHAEDAIRDVVAVLRTSLDDLFRQLRATKGTGPMPGTRRRGSARRYGRPRSP